MDNKNSYDPPIAIYLTVCDAVFVTEEVLERKDLLAWKAKAASATIEVVTFASSACREVLVCLE